MNKKITSGRPCQPQEGAKQDLLSADYLNRLKHARTWVCDVGYGRAAAATILELLKKEIKAVETRRKVRKLLIP